MKKIIAVSFLIVFVGLSFYFFFAEDYCHVHCPLPKGSFSHTHQKGLSICLCFWGNLFSPTSCDFAFLQDVMRLPVISYAACPDKPASPDIPHPPRLLSA